MDRFWNYLERCRSLKETGGLDEAAREEDAKDGEAMEEDKNIIEEALEETTGISAAIEKRAEDGETLDEDKHIGEEVLEEGSKI